MNAPTLYVIGGGGHAKVVVATALAVGRTVAGIFDEDPAKKGGQIMGVPILGPMPADPADWPDGEGVIGIGANAVRRRIAEALAGLPWAVLVHPLAGVHGTVQLGPGTVVMAGAVIQPDTVVGPHCIVNTRAAIDHDCRIGAYTHICPGATLAGSVHTGEGVLLGTGCACIPGVEIGAWSVVGAGATVIRPLPPHVVATGCPAEPRRTIG